ncbi:Ubiquinone/menaquinone biosynthesis C-methylase UbiE [Streptacidiphilus jiangxiensis]|uniref:Ubiquinone/menaquinone biosynthesis C-methylase UbiE n=2 Tax=Streptacidiphilus jiangxiensis TaxID=235985 RepID=A0A1H7F2V0_STRJI|nr:Ubiquinone/menaquinone biosynthesis C-methylase UbiE [Streptacidiphilus jiangxiensis]
MYLTREHHGSMPTTRTQQQRDHQEHGSPRERERAAAARKTFIAEGFDLVADTYGTVDAEFFRSSGSRLVELAGLRLGDRVLDVGCGRGAVLFAAATAVGPDGYVAGLDLSPGMAHATAADIAQRGLRNVTARVGDAEDPGFPTGSFEAVLAGLMLFITPDPAAVLRSAHHILVPGGRFAMSSWGAVPDPRWTRPLDAALAFLDDPLPASSPRQGARGGHPAFDTAESIAELFTACGFTQVRTVEETSVHVIESGEAWWRSQWSTGRRAWLEKIPHARRDAAKSAALAELDELRDPDGILRSTTALRFTTAVREA